MKNDYFRKYITHFKLIKTADNSFSDTFGRKVLLVMDNKFFIRETENIWKPYSQGDLAESIINNIPLHS
jgi:hypothetical protein